MPYLQLDVPNRFPLDVKRGLARRLGDIYAHIMQTAPDLVTVAFRELGEGSVWCCGTGEPEPAALISCDVRRGRPPEQRAELAQALIDACVETLGLRGEPVGVHPARERRGCIRALNGHHRRRGRSVNLQSLPEDGAVGEV
jgi:phenylpyruvate tautomerase PptA (4-oxalocrotonate tautomerase family)